MKNIFFALADLFCLFVTATLSAQTPFFSGYSLPGKACVTACADIAFAGNAGCGVTVIDGTTGNNISAIWDLTQICESEKQSSWRPQGWEVDLLYSAESCLQADTVITGAYCILEWWYESGDQHVSKDGDFYVYRTEVPGTTVIEILTIAVNRECQIFASTTTEAMVGEGDWTATKTTIWDGSAWDRHPLIGDVVCRLTNAMQ